MYTIARMIDMGELLDHNLEGFCWFYLKVYNCTKIGGTEVRYHLNYLFFFFLHENQICRTVE